MKSNALWIPDRALELQLRFCVETHYHSAGHRAYETTQGAIKEYVAWTMMTKDVKVFVQNCLHYVATIPGDTVPRPLGMQLYAIKLNEILNFDFLYIGLSRDVKYQYLSRLMDDLSGYLWLAPCRTADSAATVSALMRCFQYLVSCCYGYRTEEATSRTKLYDDCKHNSRLSIISELQVARGRMALSSPHVSRSYVPSL
jgi:Integrase zinc binding domain